MLLLIEGLKSWNDGDVVEFSIFSMSYDEASRHKLVA